MRVLLSLWLLLLFPTDVKGDCPRPTTSEHASLKTDSEFFKEGSTVRLQCHPGYEQSSQSPRSITCSGGQWSSNPEDFICQRKSCGNPGDFSNGYYDYSEGILFTATITATCRPGFFMLGQSTRTCLANGEWDGSHPVCQVRTCKQPPDVPNGKPHHLKEEYEHSQVVQYDCDPGYTFVGEGQNFVTCDDGSWSGTPQCQRVICDKPVIPNARRVEGGSGPYGHKYTLKFECLTGHKLKSGMGRTVCSKDGWSPLVECEVVECPNPGTTNATITEGAGPPYVYSVVVGYECQIGQTLVGSSRMTCGPDGQWSSHPPLCKVVECPNPGTTNATITEGAGPPYVSGAFVGYGCHIGLRLIGSPQLICGSDGQWSSNPPVCRVVECPEPIKTNAIVGNGEGGPYRLDHVIQYQCLHHLQLHGESHLKCGHDGQWSAKPPVCKEKHPNWRIVAAVVCSVLVAAVVCGVLGYYYFHKRSNSVKISNDKDVCEPTPSPDNGTVLTPLKENISPSASSEPDPV